MFQPRRSRFKKNSFRSSVRGSSFGEDRPNRFSVGFNNQSKTSKRPQKSVNVEHLLKEQSFQTPKTHIQADEVTHAFSDFPIADFLKQNILAKAFTKPTPIQDKAIPAILEGRDVIGIANTGTGKTAAFLIPLLNKIHKDPSQKALILAPTRELALQIYDELQFFAKGSGIFATICIGGSDMRRQQANLRNNRQIVIGTPGRIKDLIQRNWISLQGFTTVVLDEVDRMVDIGFINDVKFFISLLPKERQSLFFSATVSKQVDEILNSFVKNPVVISVKTQDTSHNIEQSTIKVSNQKEKLEKLYTLLQQEGFDKVLVFGRTKWGIERTTKELERRGMRVGSIHGNKSQGHRQRTLKQFKNSEIQVLLATDIASRGLDIADVTHVINYDPPATKEDYIHRIGRTGRADKKGIALSFIG